MQNGDASSRFVSSACRCKYPTEIPSLNKEREAFLSSEEIGNTVKKFQKKLLLREAVLKTCLIRLC